jgi:putative SOS response-associated peptidase YedK
MVAVIHCAPSVPAAGGVFAVAGLWERWKNPQDGGILRSFTIVTGQPNGLGAPIHHRMPVILPPSAWPAWLSEADADRAALLALLRPCPDEAMRVYPVGPRVGNVRNDDPGLLEQSAPAAEKDHCGANRER